MRDVAVVSFAQSATRRDQTRNEVEILMPVLREAMAPTGLTTHDIGFTCSGSSDYLAGQAFAFVSALDAVGPWPPIQESHVEMDGAWALYEAWVRLQHGDVDTALVYAFGRSSMGDLVDVLSMQLDPYYLMPLGVDARSLAGLQATLRGAILDEGPRIADGAAAIVLGAGPRASDLCARPAWISAIDHRIEPHSIGARDLSRSRSTEIAAAHTNSRRAERAFVHANYAHEVDIVREALGVSAVEITKGPLMVAGLSTIGAAARAILDGKAQVTAAHATSGPCLQQNLVCVLEARP